MSNTSFSSYKESYENYLLSKELSRRTINKYIHDVEHFYNYLNGSSPSPELAIAYKAHLKEKYKISTVNSYLISLNCYFKWLGDESLYINLIKSQRRYFSPSELQIEDYRKMLDYSLANDEKKWYLIMRCLGGLGIRVGELRYITVESVISGYTEIIFKAKCREILIPDGLKSELTYYALEEKIKSGDIFLNKRKTKALDTSVIWRNLKRIARLSGVDEKAVYPHNFRHLFARVYMETYHNIAMLADILGHSSIETTRIYTMCSKETQRFQLDHLGL